MCSYGQGSIRAALEGGKEIFGRQKHTKPLIPRDSTTFWDAQNAQDHWKTLKCARVLLPDIPIPFDGPTHVHIARAAHSRSSPRPPVATCPLRAV